MGLPEICKTHANWYYFQSITRNLCNLGIHRVGSFCINSMSSDAIPSYLLWEADPYSLATDA